MKKLKLKLDDLEVSSFAAQHESQQPGTVNAMASYEMTCLAGGCGESRIDTECACTHLREEGCYPSLYCTLGPAQPGEETCYEGCMTNANGQC